MEGGGGRLLCALDCVQQPTITQTTPDILKRINTHRHSTSHQRALTTSLSLANGSQATISGMFAQPTARATAGQVFQHESVLACLRDVLKYLLIVLNLSYPRDFLSTS